GVAGAGRERVRAVAERGAERDGADDQRGEGVGVAGEAADGGAEGERDRCALEPAGGERGERRRQRIDGDRLGGRGRGAEVALGIPGGGGHAEREVGVGGRGDGEARQVPAVHVDGGVAGAGRERVRAVAERGAERDGADDQRGEGVGVAGEAADGGAEGERDRCALEPAGGERGERRRQRIDGDRLGGRGRGAEVALGIPGGGGHAEREVGVGGRGDGEARQVPAVHVDGGVAGAGRERVRAVAERGAERDGADDQRGEGVGVAGEAADGGAEGERDRCALEPAGGERGERRRQRIDGDRLGGRGRGAEVALGIPGGGGHAEREVGVGGRGDGEARQVPAVHVDGGVAGAGRERVRAVAERGAERDGADDQRGEGVGVAGEAADGGAEGERDRCALEPAGGERGERRRQRIDGDRLGGRGRGAEVALGIPGGGGHAEREVGVGGRGDGEARQVPAVHVDGGVAGAGRERVRAVAERGAERDGADDQRGEGVGVAGEAADGGAEGERDRCALEPAGGERGERRRQRIDGDRLGGRGRGAEVALGIPGGGGHAEREVGVGGRGDGEARQVPAVHVDGGVAGAGRERVRAVAERGAERDGADDQRGEGVGVAGEAADGGAEGERDRCALEPAGGERGERRRQRIDGDRLGGRGGGAEVALGIPGGGGHAEREVGVGGRGDGEARQVPAVHVDGGVAGAGRERV